MRSSIEAETATHQAGGRLASGLRTRFVQMDPLAADSTTSGRGAPPRKITEAEAAV